MVEHRLPVKDAGVYIEFPRYGVVYVGQERSVGWCCVCGMARAQCGMARAQCGMVLCMWDGKSAVWDGVVYVGWQGRSVGWWHYAVWDGGIIFKMASNFKFFLLLLQQCWAWSCLTVWMCFGVFCVPCAMMWVLVMHVDVHVMNCLDLCCTYRLSPSLAHQMLAQLLANLLARSCRKKP